jgi:DNA (cytosine-5)-methyltransferase 1
MGGICEITNIIKQANNRDATFGYLGDWRVAAAVLFERESLQGNIKPSRKKREEVTANAEGSVGTTVFAGNQQSEIAATLQTTCDDYSRADGFNVIIDRAAFNQGENAPKDVADTVSARYGTGGGNTPLVQQPFRKVRRAQSDSDFETWEKDETANTINCFDVGDVRSTNVVAQPISIDAECNARTNQFGTLVRGGEGGTQQFVAQPIAIQDVRPIEKAQNGRGWNDDGTSYTVDTKATQGVAQPLYYESHPQDSRVNGPKDVANTVSANYGMGGGNTPLVQQPMAIRRLTPKECERLQGFPDDWTKIPYRNKPADQCPDGPRYKACGNSMAVPVMRWIGERINLIESML